jgi:hypothetical protein
VKIKLLCHHLRIVWLILYGALADMKASCVVTDLFRSYFGKGLYDARTLLLTLETAQYSP